MADDLSNTNSVTGEEKTEDKNKYRRWADKQTAATERVTAVTNSRYSVAQTSASYALAKSTVEENNGTPPTWAVLDLTQLIGPEVQEAMNKVRDAADMISAYADSAVAIAQLAASIVRANASIIELLINTIRNEIKDILDSLVAAGSGYALYIPPSSKFGGGTDYYRKMFYDSLSDKNDPRRPLIKNTHAANACFMLIGAPHLQNFLPWLSKMRGFFLDLKPRDAFDSPKDTKMVGPGRFNVEARFSPAWKLLKQDYLKAYEAGEGDIGFLRKLEGMLSFTESVAKLHAAITWDMSEETEFEVGYADADTASFLSYYRATNYFQENLKDGSLIFTKEEVIPTHYLIVRTSTAEEMGDITKQGENHPAIKSAISNIESYILSVDDIEVGGNGMGIDSKIYIGKIKPGMHWLSDTDIKRPDDKSVTNVLGSVPVPKGPASKNYVGRDYFYKMCFLGVSRRYKVKYQPTGVSNFSGKEYNLYFSDKDAGKVTPALPFSEKAGSSFIPDIFKLDANDFINIYARCDAIYEHNPAKAASRWIFSEWSPVEQISNSTITRNKGIPPNWYSLALIDLLPPLKALIDQAKLFVDNVADSLIESLNAILEWVDALVRQIETWAAEIKKLMELIKSLLFPPMAGIHVLTISTNRGISGIKKQFEMSFRGAPVSSTGEKDYPDEYIRYGSRVNYKGYLADVCYGGGENAKLILSKQKDDRNLRMSEPNNEDMRRLGIPIYDSNHFTGGFVFIFEQAAIFSAFIRLLNLDSFIDNEVEKAKKELIGVESFNRVYLPNLSVHKVKSRNEKLADRLAAMDKYGENATDPNGDGDTATIESLEKAGITINPATGDIVDSESSDNSGNKSIFTDSSEPFVFTAPSVLIFVVNGKPVVVSIEAGSYSAQNLSDKINAAVAKAFGNYTFTFVNAVDGKLSFATPPDTIGDKSSSFYLGASSSDFDSMIKRGVRFAKATLPLISSEVSFPYSDGDYITELLEFGTPALSQIMAVPASFEYRRFISDPDLQDFNPSRCRLKMELDSTGIKTIDVTGNLGGNPVDSVPEVFISCSFPISLDNTENRFKVEVQGEFVKCSNVSCVISDFVNVTSAVDFFAIGVRSGDSISFNSSVGGVFKTTVTDVDENGLTIDSSFVLSDSNCTIVNVTRAGLPLSLLTNDLVSKTCSLPITTTKTYSTIDELRGDIQKAINDQFGDSAFLVDKTDETVPRLRIYLKDFGIGDDVFIRILGPGINGGKAAILTNTLTSYFPLTVTPAQTKFRIELIGASLGGESVGEKTITLGVGVYPTLEVLRSEIQAKLDVIYDDVVVSVSSGKLLFTLLDPSSYPYYLSSKVGLRIKGLKDMASTTMPSAFSSGVSLPPVVSTPAISSSLEVKSGYGDKFFVAITPVVSGRSSGAVEVTIPNGVYSSMASLRDGISSGLSKAGLVEGASGFIRASESGSGISFSLRPEESYLGSGSSLSILNGRSILPTLTGGAVTFSEMRDYNYSKIYEWLAANPTQQPTPGFPVPAPLAFLASNYGATSGPTVYDGKWVVSVGVNDSFDIRINAPSNILPLISKEWVVVTLPAATYNNFAEVVTAVQARLDALYGAGIITASSIGTDQLRLGVVKTEFFGSFVTLETRGHGNFPFLSFGTQTAAAVSATGAGGGDRRLMELIGMNDTLGVGVDDLFETLHIMDGVSDEDAEGVPFIESRGVDDFNLLRRLSCPPQENYGSYKIPYTMDEIISNINNAYPCLVADNFLNLGKVRITGRVRGIAGNLRINCTETESAEVAGLVFGFTDSRNTDVVVRGIGSSVKCAQLDTEVLEDELNHEVMQEWLEVSNQAEEYLVVLEAFDNDGTVSVVA